MYRSWPIWCTLEKKLKFYSSYLKLRSIRKREYLRRRLWVLIFKKRVWRRLSVKEFKCKELKTCLLLFLFVDSEFKSIQNHLNPLNKWVNSISIEKRTHSFNGDLLNKPKIWFCNSVAKFNTKKKIPFNLKPTTLKNLKNKWKVHLKTCQMDFEVENEWRRGLPCISFFQYYTEVNQIWRKREMYSSKFSLFNTHKVILCGIECQNKYMAQWLNIILSWVNIWMYLPFL
jgi:hypothetical protein